MNTPTTIKLIRDRVLVYATRGSLEYNLRWFYKALGKAGKESYVNRQTLEELCFIQDALNISPTGVYQLLVNEVPYRHAYYSGAEVMNYLQKNCHIPYSEEIDHLRTSKDNKPIQVKFVCYTE